MSSISRPKGPLPASVYRRRRLVLLLALVAVVAIIVLIIVRPGSASGEKTPSGGSGSDPRSSATGPASNAPSNSASPGGACAPKSVRVVPLTDASSYAAGVQPQLSLSITNTGTSPCTFDVGTGAQDYTISSGSERIWDSKDCQTGPTSDVRTLDPGSTLTTQPFSWDRTRSSTSTCTGARTAVVAGGASYHLGASVGSATAEATKQFILN